MSERRLNVVQGHLKPLGFNKVSQVTPLQQRYTVPGGKLTEQQRNFYEEHGYIVVPGAVSRENLEIYKQQFERICNGEVNVPGLTLMRDVSLKKDGVSGERAVNKIQDFQFDETLFGYCLLPEILDHVESVVGPNVMAMHTMLINKPPDTGSLTSRHPLHQDLHYFPFRPADRIVCAWTALERVHRGNGCLVVQPGSHRTPGRLLEHGYPQWEGGVNKFYHGILELGPDAPRVHLEMEAGDTVFFHPLLIHGSGANRTHGFRKAISCHYAASDCAYIDISGTTQENLAKEVMQLAQKRVGEGVKVTIQDVWSVRCRIARGQEINL